MDRIYHLWDESGHHKEKKNEVYNLIFLQKKNTEMSINFFCKPMSGQESFHISPKLSQKVIFVFRMLSDSDHVRVQMSETQYLMEMMTIFFISCNKFYIVMTSDCDIKVLKVGPLSPLTFSYFDFIFKSPPLLSFHHLYSKEV